MTLDCETVMHGRLPSNQQPLSRHSRMPSLPLLPWLQYLTHLSYGSAVIGHEYGPSAWEQIFAMVLTLCVIGVFDLLLFRKSAARYVALLAVYVCMLSVNGHVMSVVLLLGGYHLI